MKFNNIHSLKDIIDDCKNIVIIPHFNPDGDAIGSSLALHGILKQLNKKSTVISPNMAPNFYSWTPSYNEIIYFDEKPENCIEILNQSDLIFTLDFNDLKRIGDLGNELEKTNSKIVMIDHHQNPTNYATLNFSFPNVGSTCELLYEILLSLDFEMLINKDISTCLYLGIMTDTGSFQYNSVTSRTHQIISRLLDQNIDHNFIYNKVYNDSSSSRLKVLGIALNNLIHIKELNTAYMFLTKEDLENSNYKKGDSEGIVNYGLSLKDVVFCAIFIEDLNEDNNVKISFRSIGNFKCNEFANDYFSGGGHINAAGGKYEGSSKKAIDHFLKNIFNYKNKLT